MAAGWALAALMLVGFGVRDLLAVRRDATTGVATLSTLTEARDVDGARSILAAGQSRLALADRRAHSPTLNLLAHVPLAGRQVRSIQHLAASGNSAAETADALLDELDKTSERVTSPDQRGPALKELAGAIASARHDLSTLDAGPSTWLLPQLRDARQEFAARRQTALDATDRLEKATEAMATMVEGPSTYLLLAGNNAEMRAGIGTPLFVGEVRIVDGEMDLGELVKPNDWRDLDPEPRGLDRDVASNFNRAGSENDLRMVGFTARFDAVASDAAAIWEAHTGRRPDGVIAFDVELIRLMLTATGPIDAAGQPLDSTTVVPFLTAEQYALGGERRYEIQRVLAERVLDQLQRPEVLGDYSTLRAMATGASGRHLQMWAADPSVQTGWVAAGVSGTLADHDVHVGLLNRGPDKLDALVDISADLAVVGEYRQRTDLRLRVTVTNRATGSEPAYVLGPGDAGAYHGFLLVSTPREARFRRIVGEAKFVDGGPDGDTHQLSAFITIPAGETATVEYHFALAPERTSLRIVPSGRLTAVQWSFGTKTWSDDRPVSIELGTAGRAGAGRFPVRPQPAEAGGATATPSARDSVFTVTSEGCEATRVGTGFAVATDLVATAAHVVSGASTVQISGEFGTIEATPVLVDVGLDVALLRTTRTLTPLPLGASRTGLGDGVVTGRHNDLLDHHRVTFGQLELLNLPTGDGSARAEREVFVIGGEIDPGDSGSPVLDEQGKVAGLAFGRDVTDRTLGYAVPASTLRAIVERVAEGTPRASSSCVAPPPWASAAAGRAAELSKFSPSSGG